MIGRVRDSLYLALTGIAVSGMLVACGGDNGTNGGGGGGGGGGGNGTGTGTSTINGSIEASYAYTTLEMLRLGAPPRPGAERLQPTPDSVFGGLPVQNGNLTQEGPGQVQSGTDDYELVEIPAGRSRLVVFVIAQEPGDDGEKPHIGRVLVYEATTDGGQITNEPMNNETSLEGGIHMGAMIGQHTPPRGHINNPQIGLVTRVSEETARTAATTRNQLQALVAAYLASQDVYVRGFQQMGVSYADSTNINAGLSSVAQSYAEARAGGTGHQAAHEDFIDGAVDTYLNNLGDTQAFSITWGAYGAVHDSRLVGAGVPEQLRLESAQNLLNISVHASEKLVESADAPDAAKTAVTDALSQIRTDALAATSMADLMAAVSDGRQSGIADLEAALGQEVDEAAANLSAFLDTSQNPPTIAGSLPDYVAQVEGAESDAAVQDLLIALMGGPGYQ